MEIAAPHPSAVSVPSDAGDQAFMKDRRNAR